MNAVDPAARLRPDMASFRLLVLDFVRDYIARWDAGPSYGEIAAGLDTDRFRVRWAVKKLVKRGQLVQRAGHRGLAMPDDASRAAAVLQAAGWSIDLQSKTATNTALPRRVVLDYIAGDEQP